MTFKRITLLTASALILAACAGGEATKKAPELDNYVNQAQNHLKQMPAYVQQGTITERKGHYLGRKFVRKNAHRDLPPRFSEHTYIWTHAKEVSLDEVARIVRDDTGLPTYVDNREFAGSQDAKDDAENKKDVVDRFGSLNAEKPKEKILIQQYRGKLSGFLNLVSHFFGYDWRYEEGVVYFDKYTTHVYMVKAPLGKSQMTSVFGAQNSAGSGNSNGAQATSNTVDFDVWNEIEQGVSKMLPKGATYTVSKSTGTISVTARPNDQKMIAKYIKDMNAILSPRISIQITALLVDITDDDEFGFSLEAALEGANGLGLDMLPFDSAISGLNGVASLNVTNSKSGTKLNHLEGSKALLRAINSSNRLVDHWTATTILQNNTPGPINLTTEKEYVRNVSVNNLSDTGNTQVTTETVTAYYGQSLQIVPRIQGNDEIIVALSLNSADTPTFTNFSASSDATVQMRQQAKRDLRNEVPIGNGETLILSGFEQTTSTRLNEGVGSPDNIALGGTRDAELRRTRLILMITPTIMQRPQNRDLGTTRVLHDGFDLLSR